LTEFLAWRLPERGESRSEDVADLLSELKKSGYTRLAQLDKALQKAETAIKAYETNYPPWDPETGEEGGLYSPVGAVRIALSFTDDKYYEKYEGAKERISKFKALVKN
jgi:hypothetical protein